MRKITIILLILVLFSFSVTLTVSAENEIFKKDASVSKFKNDAKRLVKNVLWFLRAFGIIGLAVAAFRMYRDPDAGKPAFVSALIATALLVVSPALVSAIYNFFN